MIFTLEDLDRIKKVVEESQLTIDEVLQAIKNHGDHAVIEDIKKMFIEAIIGDQKIHGGEA